MDELESERDVAIETIADLGMQPIHFKAHAGSEDPLTESLKLVQESDIVIVMLWKRYSKVVYMEYNCAISQNKPILVLEKELNGKEQRKKRLSHLLDQIKNRHTYKEFRKPSQLRDNIINGLQQVIHNIFSGTIIKLPNEEIYTQIRTILHDAKKICILSRTPNLLFGARDYLSENKSPEEKQGHKTTLNQWKAAIKGEKEFTLIISSHSVVKEIESSPNSIKLASIVLKNFKKLKETKKSRVACTSISSDSPQYLTFIIADDTVVIWIKSHTTHHCIKSKNKDIAYAFRQMADECIRIDNKNNYKDTLVGKIKDIIKDGKNRD